jgi:uncharacterized short protein YbdD (DUF466 family)
MDGFTLFSYRVRVDFGSAPNPYGGICSLTICKPKIRSTAKPGDWIVGLASTVFDLLDPEHRVIYAMRVSKTLPLAEYDNYCRSELKIKIPKRPAKTYQEFVGDCVYNYSEKVMVQRPSVHDENDMARDLGGKNALLSDHFFYFGSKAVALPPNLWGIAKRGVAHQSHLNDAFREDFVLWIESAYQAGKLYGDPLNRSEDWARKLSCGQTDDEEDNANNP